jgi:hypothetical protein
MVPARLTSNRASIQCAVRISVIANERSSMPSKVLVQIRPLAARTASSLDPGRILLNPRLKNLGTFSVLCNGVLLSCSDAARRHPFNRYGFRPRRVPLTYPPNSLLGLCNFDAHEARMAETSLRYAFHYYCRTPLPGGTTSGRQSAQTVTAIQNGDPKLDSWDH